MKLPYPRNKKGTVEWIAKFGATDQGYFLAHYDRWMVTKAFALDPAPIEPPLTILDMGAHWLHNAYLYAIDGHHVIGMDAPDTIVLPAVRAVAEQLGVQLVPIRRMEMGDGLETIEDDNINLVLFARSLKIWPSIRFHFRNRFTEFSSLVAALSLQYQILFITEI